MAITTTGWTHQQCERCWFDRNTKYDPMTDETTVRMPIQVVDPDEPNGIDNCCFCGKPCVTNIFVRSDPKALEYCLGHDDD